MNFDHKGKSINKSPQELGATTEKVITKNAVRSLKLKDSTGQNVISSQRIRGV